MDGEVFSQANVNSTLSSGVKSLLWMHYSFMLWRFISLFFSFLCVCVGFQHVLGTDYFVSIVSVFKETTLRT